MPILQQKTGSEPANVELVLTEDLSNGAEPCKVRVLNQVNAEQPKPFEYITSRENDASNLEDDCSQKLSNIARPDSFFQVFYANPVKGWALQTLGPIDDGTPIFEYTGVLSKAADIGTEMKQCDDYIIGFTHNGENYVLDAFRKGNLARFINHCCRPNCRAMLAKISNDGDDRHVPRVLIYALRDIRPGEELTMDYGQQWWNAKSGTVSCTCKHRMCKYGEELSNQMNESIQLLDECSISSKSVDDGSVGKAKNVNAIATKAANGKAVAIKAVGGQFAFKSVEGQEIAVKSVEGQTIAAKSVEGQAVAVKEIAAKSVEGQAVAVKEIAVKAITAKSVEGQTIAAKSVQGQAVAVKAIAAKSVEGQTIAAKSVEGQAIAAKSVDGQVIATIAAKSVDAQTVAVKSVDGGVIAAKSVAERKQFATKSVATAGTGKGVNERATAKKAVAMKAVAGGCAVATKCVVGRTVAIKTVEG
ncbi:hypothetical protein niasHT_014250 [Heterodera trifolii]|uniref:SET domain-containing protein n=1 Tax=Heterodera trifolii TaxID=157864 RepID=A0ABD2KXE8_9BILA